VIAMLIVPVPPMNSAFMLQIPPWINQWVNMPVI